MSNKDNQNRGKKAAEIAGKVTKIALIVGGILLGKKIRDNWNDPNQQKA